LAAGFLQGINRIAIGGPQFILKNAFAPEWAQRAAASARRVVRALRRLRPENAGKK